MKLDISADAVTEAAGFLQTIQSDHGTGEVRWITVKKVDGKLSLSNIGKTTTGSVVIHKDSAKIDFDQPIMVDFIKIFQLSRSLKDRIQIEIKDGWAFCRSGHSRFRIPVKTELIPEEKSIKEISPNVEDLPAAWLRTSLHASNLALAKSYYANLALSGVHIFSRGNEVFVEACDGTELFRSKISARVNSDFDLIIAKESIKAFIQALSSKADSAKVKLYASWNQLILELSDTVVRAFTQAGSFPEVGKLIKETSEFYVKAAKENIVPLLKRADIFTSNPYVQFIFTRDLLTVKAQDIHGGDFEEVCSVDYPFDDMIEMRIQIKNIASCLNEMDAADFMIRFDKDPSSIFVSPVESSSDFLYMTALGRVPSGEI